jgi:FlgD Ig-like domain
MLRARRSLVAILMIAVVAPPAIARHTGGLAHRNRQSPVAVHLAGDSGNPALRASVAAANTTVLLANIFDAGGSCTAEGWTAIDLTTSIGDFFHVDDYAGMNAANFAPLAGAHSLWCGARAQTSGPLCGYQALPGYGNSWDQAFCTKNCIAVSGDGMLDVSFLARFDSEPSYDFSTLEYTLDCSGATGWNVIDGGVNAWTGKIPAVNWLAGATYGGAYLIGTTGPVKVRLHFRSDNAWSDEDALWNTNGALHVDNLQVEGGAVEDFEGEAVGATSSDEWQNCVPPGYGIFAGLLPGLSVVQEDPCARDLSCMWTFFNGSTFNYACGGHPGQAAVPFGNAAGQYLDNEIWSPVIPMSGSGTTVNLEFSVYRDLPLDNLVFFVWHVRDVTGSCPGKWLDFNFLYYGAQKDWFRAQFPLGGFLDFATTTQIQVAIGAVDMCRFFCGYYGSGACHSQSPLIDNVKIYRVDSHGPVWNPIDIDLFQDNFASDGTITGTVRADMALDIAPGANTNSIVPGDSATIGVNDPDNGLATDTYVGGTAAVYCDVAVWPQGQANKQGDALTQDASRWPVVDQYVDGSGVTWTRLLMDSALTGGGYYTPTSGFAIDLNDNLFVPGDTVCFVFSARGNGGDVSYWTDKVGTTDDQALALANPSEFTCLPAGGYNRGGDILYVDGMDRRGAQPYWDTAFQSLGLLDKIDRYDVRGPSSLVGNTPGGRVKNVFAQVLACYRKILWDTGDLQATMGDGVGWGGKPHDYGLLNTFLGNLSSPGGVYLSGDDAGQDLDNAGGDAVTTRTTYLPFTLTSSNVQPIFGISPTGVPRAGGCYSDSFLIFGGCPLINDFDAMEPTGATTMEVGYGTPATTNGAVIAKRTTNGNSASVGVVLSGFSFIYIHDNDTDGVSDRAKFLYDTLVWLGNTPNQPTDAGPALRNSLSQNYPNPFNPTTTIAFSIKNRTRVRLSVYDVSGARVRTLADEDFAAGAHTRVWDGRNDAGQPVASGVYFYKLVAREFVKTRKMVLLK